MSTKFHIGENGPAPCHAQPGKCPINPDGSEHFDSMNEATAEYEKVVQEKAQNGEIWTDLVKQTRRDTLDTPQVDKLRELESKGLENLTPAEQNEYLTVARLVDNQNTLTFDPTYAPTNEDFDNIAKKYSNMSLKSGKTEELTPEMVEGLDYPDGFVDLDSAMFDLVEDDSAEVEAEITSFEDGTIALHFRDKKNLNSHNFYHNEKTGEMVENVHYGSGEAGLDVYQKNLETGEVERVFKTDETGRWIEYDKNRQISGSSYNGGISYYETIGSDVASRRVLGDNGLLNDTQVYHQEDASFMVHATDGVETCEIGDTGYIAPSATANTRTNGGTISLDTYSYSPGSKPVLVEYEKTRLPGAEEVKPGRTYTKVEYWAKEGEKPIRLECQDGTETPVSITDSNGKKTNIPPNHRIVTKEHPSELKYSIVSNDDNSVFYEIDATDRVLDAQNKALEQAERNRNSKTRAEFEEVKKKQYEGTFWRWAE